MGSTEKMIAQHPAIELVTSFKNIEVVIHVLKSFHVHIFFSDVCSLMAAFLN